jgi:hypothetical protein
MPNVNRSAIILKARKPLVDWVNDVDPADNAVPISLHDAQREPTVYLIPDCDSDEAAAEWVKAAFDWLFERELWGWYTDETLWPRNRTYEMFCRWFDYSVHSIVEDMSDEPLLRDEDDDN